MQFRHFLFHIALLPVYISLLVYLGLLPEHYKLSSLSRLVLSSIPKRFFHQTTSVNLNQTSINTTMNAMNFVARRSEERGHADHDWLKTFHTFSFSMYSDPKHDQFGPLRVINEDRVSPKTGFGTHPHREFEIFSYVVSGELEHKDSMGNIEILKRGDLQLTSAGTGISHAEKAHGDKQVHFLQIWSFPSTAGLIPKYFTRHYSDDAKRDKWVKVVAPAWEKDVKNVREADGPAPVQSALTMYASLINSRKSLERPLGGKKGYIHVIQTSGYNPGPAQGARIKISGPGSDSLELREGDGAYIFVGQKGNTLKVENTGDVTAEVVVFDLE